MKKSALAMALLCMFASMACGMPCCSANRALYRFTFVSPLAGDPFWMEVEDGMKAANAQYDVSTMYIGPTFISIDEHIKYIEIAIASNADGIITTAPDPEAFTPFINKAVAAGIPVVLLDADAPDSNRNFYAGTSNYKGGVIHAAIVQNPFEMGRLGVELLYQIQEGMGPYEQIIDTGVTVVTANNVNNYK